ncbi:MULTISPECIES: hypothetical protein [Streptomyces]|uniref:Uncharacterized protein n=1 Tax=Streptomyces achmelvichensis TaxID=3134111 RepID=A0ACC6Q4T5_9ACTN|nr:hypothetical protein OG317_31280 [Streptomyces sp. NBC_01167]
MSNGPDPRLPSAEETAAAVLDGWSLRIASAAAPHEADFAPHTARVYAAGGRGRRVLLRSAPSTPGGSGGELVAVLPLLWDALATSYRLLESALGSPAVGNTVSGAALLLAMRRRETPPEDPAAPAQPAPADPALLPGPQPTPESRPDAPAAAELARLVDAVVRVSALLQGRGVSRQEADRAAAEAVAALYEGHDDGALAFLGLLTGGDPPAGPGGRRGPAVSLPRRLTGWWRGRTEGA